MPLCLLSSLVALMLGGLPHRLHYDSGSVLTIDVMLAPAEEGGQFETLESDAVVGHTFERGDAIVFPSHKYHSVSPVKRGTRRVLIMVCTDSQCSARN